MRLNLRSYLQQQDLSDATVADIQQHTLDFCRDRGIDGIETHPYGPAFHYQTVEHTQHRTGRDIMYESWEVEDYVSTAQFKAYILECTELEIPKLTRNQLLIDVLKG
tara:strand:+ start:314 stop:634 length:321 start_codon:yes stop_codon:yes gene_type:complete